MNCYPQESLFAPEFPCPAPWPVWRDSSRGEVKFRPLAKKAAVRLYHKARRFERMTRTKGHQDGALGRNGLAVLHVLAFDFLSYATGELVPSIAAIAHKACISERSVARGLQKLRAAGVINWLRRCKEEWEDGVFRLRQLSNAYAILPVTQWRGYPPEPPEPKSWAWGACPPLPDVISQACREPMIRGMLEVLEVDPRDKLAVSLARLGREAARRW